MSHWAAEYAALLSDHCEQGILLTNSAFSITRANPRAVAILGAASQTELEGARLHGEEVAAGIRLHPDFAGADGAGPRSGRYMVTAGDSVAFPAHVDFLDAGGGDWLVLVADRTRQVGLDQEAFQSEKLAAMDNIVAGIAHELNNPMTAILGYAELLLETERDNARKQRISLIAEEADRCGKIIKNMLTFTRSHGHALETGNVNDILEEVVGLQAYQLHVDGIKIHGFYDQAMPVMNLQPEAIRRLFLNLIHNAHQALIEKNDGRRNLWAMTECRDGACFIQIADDGPGIPAAIRHQIFDPFFTTRTFGTGMGLGLSVAYGIVHEHGGKIWMEPRVGGGTAMNISLPLRHEMP